MTPAGPPFWNPCRKSLWVCQSAVVVLGYRSGAMMTDTREPSQVIRTVQLKPRIERKPNLLCE